MDCGNDSSLTPSDSISVCAWINASASQGQYPQICAYSAGTDGYNLYLYNQSGEGAASFILREIGESWSDAWAVGAVDLKGDGNHFLVGTYNGSIINIFVDAELAGTDTTSGTGIDYSANTLQIGAKNSGNNEFAGIIDDVQIYNRALSVEEIKQLYHLTRK